jgi:ABC-type Mn2+/Zn2+ transport system ATPase subunit
VPGSITASGLTVRYGREAALEDISVEIPPSSTVALLGPNGAGKTTFFRAAIGIARPSSAQSTWRAAGSRSSRNGLTSSPHFR